MEKEIKKIKIRQRLRKDLGDLDELAESMQRVGLINPVIINTNNELLAGERRLVAAKELGWQKIPVRIIKTKGRLQKLDLELEENITRRDFNREETEKGLKLRNKLRYRSLQGPLMRLLLWLWSFIKKLFGKE
ncbi:MAG TPA: ParB N-terminal domain-containing protein [Spirochaetota bacterium]|nr:ParB N-terminal domain-containing protein [Spirochaetota bacterium]